MKQPEINVQNSLDTELQVLENHNSVWSGNPAMVAAENSLRLKAGGINAASQAQKITTKPTTETKKQAKETMASLGFAHEQAGIAFATANNNTELKEKLHYSFYEIRKAKDEDADDICQIIHDAVKPYINCMSDFGANASSLSSLQTAIHTFQSLIGKPRSVKAVPVSATKSVKQLIKEARNLNNDLLDPLMEQYKVSHPDFYKEYHVARVIVDIGRRTITILQGIVSDGINPVANALVKVLDTKKKKKTTANGKFKFLRLKPITYTIVVTAQNYKPAKVTVSVTENEVNKVVVVMEKK